jgi:diphosphomevalonate decarboxylase
MSEARVVAHPNIALAKYWGKLAGDENLPAVPSLSVTLDGVATRTSVAFRDDLDRDALTINGDLADAAALARASTMLDRVRAASGEKRFAEITSRNDFPTSSGLASSASGFAALALAAVRAAGLDWDATRVSDLARRTSASAARSLFGGYAELLAGTPGETTLSARPVAAADHLDLRVLICVTTEAKKSIGSTEGMRTTAASSPYYARWLDEAPRNYRALRDALLAKDFEAMGALAEASALAMHASMIAANIVYWNGVTIEGLAAVRALRARGTAAYATIDAGPHVKVLTRAADAALVATWMRAVPGVLRVIECAPGEGARLEGGSET